MVADGTGAEIKERSGRRTVSFDLHGAGTAGLDLLAGVREVVVKGARVTLHTDDADATVTNLVHSGRSFAGLEVTSAGLESAFLALTSDPAPAVA